MHLTKKQIIVFLFIILTIVLAVRARPNSDTNWDKSNNPCIHDDLKIEICQRCAKQTKSPIVYPMCCNEQDNVYSWCIEYTHFGH